MRAGRAERGAAQVIVPLSAAGLASAAPLASGQSLSQSEPRPDAAREARPVAPTAFGELPLAFEAVAVDGSGKAFLSGITVPMAFDDAGVATNSFPVKSAYQPACNGGYSDACLTKLDPPPDRRTRP